MHHPTVISAPLRKPLFDGGPVRLLRMALAFIFVGVSLIAQASEGQTIVTFVQSAGNNTFTFTIPQGVTQITVEAWGAGGGSSSSGSQRPGGGGGAYARSILDVTPGQAYAITTGIGGGEGQAGGSSVFRLGGTELVRAPGGQAGTFSGNSGTGGSGGAVGIGQVTFSGGRGGNTSGDRVGGGGGSSAGSDSNGNNAFLRNGGSAPIDGGGGGSIANESNNTSGENGGFPGGGGAGKNGPGASGVTGRGGDGQIKISYFSGNAFTLSGTILDAGNQPVPGVHISFSGGYPTVVTDQDGTYNLQGVFTGATGITITPGLAGYTFEPTAILVEGPVSADVGGLDFTATPVSETFSISGTILHDTTPLQGVTVTASGDHEQTVSTNASGAYQISGITAGASLTIAPTSNNHVFLPPEIQFVNVMENLSGQDFAAQSSGDHYITGTILDEANNPVEGVIVTASGAFNQTVSTNHLGVFLFTGMNNNGQITITPTLAGYSFSPEQRTVAYHHNQSPRFYAQDFTAIQASGHFYSRQNGNWNTAATWSRTGHSGSAASRAPGQGDHVYVSNSHRVSLVENVTNNQSITLSNGGTLITGQYIVSGSGSFILAGQGVLHIGHMGGISQSGSTGNIQTSVRNFSSEGHYVYNGSQAQSAGNALPETIASLTIDNPAGVAAVSSHRVTGQLILQNGTLIMPVGGSMAAAQTVSSDGNLRMRTAFQGGKGWRMITSPVQTTYSDMFSGGFITLGFAGSSNPAGQPNLLYFDETDIGTTNQAWRTIPGLGQGTHGGRGYFYYVFAGEGGYSDNLPREMNATGLEHAAGSGTYNFPATFTARAPGIVDNTEVMELNAGWNLVGNPSSATLDWSNEAGWTRQNIANTFYIWSPSAGTYFTWNGIVGSGSARIAPFQAFWVQATGANPVFQMHAGAKGLGGSFAQKGLADQLSELRSRTPVLHMEIQADTLLAFAHLSFINQGRFGEDPWDAYRLEPLSDTFLKLYTTSSMHDKPLVINNMPEELKEPVQVPLYVGGQKGGVPVTGSYTLNWYQSGQWPESWSVTLMDHQLEKAVNMKRNHTYTFTETGGAKSISVQGGAKSISGQGGAKSSATQGRAISPAHSHLFSLPQQIIASHDPATAINPVAKASTAAPRFTIVINPNGTFDEEEPEYIPNEPRMMPPFPNPFDHQTTLRFSLPAAAHVMVEVLDLQGRRVALLADRQFESGTTTIPWTPNRLPMGVYIAVMRTADRVETQKISLVR